MTFRKIATSLALLSFATGSLAVTGCSDSKNSNEATISKKKLKEMNAKFKSAQEAELKAKQSVEAATKAQSEAEKSKADYEAQLAALSVREATLKANEVTVADGLATIAAFEKSKQDNEQVIAALQEAKKTIEIAKTEIEAQAAATKTEIEGLEAQLATKKTELEGLKNEAESTRSTTESQLREIEVAKADLQAILVDTLTRVQAAEKLSAQMDSREKDLKKQSEELDQSLAAAAVLFKNLGRDKEFANLMKGNNTFNVQVSVVGIADEPELLQIRKIFSDINLNKSYQSYLSPNAAALASKKAGGKRALSASQIAALPPVQKLRVRDRYLLNSKGGDILSAMEQVNGILSAKGSGLIVVPQTVDSVIVRYSIHIEMQEVDTKTGEVRTYNVSPIPLTREQVFKDTNAGSVDLMALGQQGLSNELESCSANILICLETLKKKGVLLELIDTNDVAFRLKSSETTDDSELREYFDALKTQGQNLMSKREFIQKLIGLSATQAMYHYHSLRFNTPSEPLKKGKIDTFMNNLTNDGKFMDYADGRLPMISKISIVNQFIMPIQAPRGYTPIFTRFDSEAFRFLDIPTGVSKIDNVSKKITSLVNDERLNSNPDRDLIELGDDKDTGLPIDGAILNFESQLAASATVFDFNQVKDSYVTASETLKITDMAKPYGSKSSELLKKRQRDAEQFLLYYNNFEPLFNLLEK